MSEYLIQSSTLEDIADAIRTKTGGSALINPEDMADVIASISGGGIDFIDFDEGEFTVTSDGLTALTINHNLGVVPFCCMVIPVTNKSDGRHVVGGITFLFDKNIFHTPNGTSLSSPTQSYSYYTKFGFYAEASKSSLTADVEIPAVNQGNYIKNITATSFDLTASSSYPIMSGITYRWRALAFNSNL